MRQAHAAAPQQQRRLWHCRRPAHLRPPVAAAVAVESEQRASTSGRTARAWEPSEFAAHLEALAQGSKCVCGQDDCKQQLLAAQEQHTRRVQGSVCAFCGSESGSTCAPAPPARRHMLRDQQGRLSLKNFSRKQLEDWCVSIGECHACSPCVHAPPLATGGPPPGAHSLTVWLPLARLLRRRVAKARAPGVEVALRRRQLGALAAGHGGAAERPDGQVRRRRRVSPSGTPWGRAAVGAGGGGGSGRRDSVFSGFGSARRRDGGHAQSLCV